MNEDNIKLILKSNFPKPSYREYQEDVLEKCCEILEYNRHIYEDITIPLSERKSKTKVIIIRSPTGSGKSAIAVTLCRIFGDAYYITPQKKLQEQLMIDFSEYMNIVKGRGNFKCKDSGDRLFCNEGICQERKKNFKCEFNPKKLFDRMKLMSNEERNRCFDYYCDYVVQRNIGALSPIVLMNFAYFMLCKYTRKFETRNLLVIDECHNIQKNVYDFITVEIQERWSGEIPIYKEGIEESVSKDVANRYIKWLKNTVLLKLQVEKDKILKQRSEMVEDEINEITGLNLLKTSNVEDESDDDDKLEQIKKKIDKIENLIDGFTNYPDDWVFDVGNNNQGKFIKFRPVIVGRFMEKYVWNMANNIVLMSGSIPNPEVYLREVGLEEKFKNNLVEIIDVPSTFPKNNRLIVYAPVGKLVGVDKNQKLQIIKKMSRFIEDVVGRKFINKNGIIHCQSYENLEMLYSCFSGDFRRNVIKQERGNREDSLNLWLDNGGMFLSVNMKEGLDLVDDLCRFQFCIKVPYPNLGDKIIRKRVRSRHETDWYNNESLVDIIQMYGRAVRSKKDYAEFFILDSSFITLYRKSEKHIPEYIKECIRQWRLSG